MDVFLWYVSYKKKLSVRAETQGHKKPNSKDRSYLGGCVMSSLRSISSAVHAVRQVSERVATESVLGWFFFASADVI